jgi:predicted dehydrogenase
MKLCMVGVRGHMGYVFDGLRLMPHVELAGVSAGAAGDDVSVLTGPAEAMGRAPKVFDDVRAMLDACQPDVLAVAGPFEDHAATCAEAFGRGIHVFCEKPVALSLDELAMLKAAHADSGVHFASMMGLRYDPAFFAAHNEVIRGIIGEVRLIEARKSYKLGERAAFYRQRSTYGGTIPWVGSHAVDWVHWFTGGAAFESVYATHSAAHNRGHGELEISALCHFTLADDIFASVAIDYLRPESAATHGDDRIRVVGTKGLVEVADGRARMTEITWDSEVLLPNYCNCQIFADFVAAAEGVHDPLITPAETFAVTEACLRARQSADEDRVVRFDEDGA